MINRQTLPIIFIAGLLILAALWIGFSLNEEGTISLQWNANSEADLAGYRVYYGTSPGNYTQSVVVSSAASLKSGTVNYRLKGLIKNQVYFIAVTAFNKSGKESPCSDEVVGLAR